MGKYDKITSTRSYVKTQPDKDTAELEAAGLRWLKALSENRLNYEIDWLGVPVIQTPEDLVLMQELIFKVRPDYIIETGIAHGGGLIFYASMMELLGKGKVIGIDIEIREHNRQAIETHPLAKRITLIEADSASPATLEKISKTLKANSNVVVCLDSDHHKPHVLKELELYKGLVKPGGYIVVFDTAIARLEETQYAGNSPKEAIDEFLKNNPEFEIDKAYNKLYVSSAPDGYLKRTR